MCLYCVSYNQHCLNYWPPIHQLNPVLLLLKRSLGNSSSPMQSDTIEHINLWDWQRGKINTAGNYDVFGGVN